VTVLGALALSGACAGQLAAMRSRRERISLGRVLRMAIGTASGTWLIEITQQGEWPAAAMVMATGRWCLIRGLGGAGTTGSKRRNAHETGAVMTATAAASPAAASPAAASPAAAPPQAQLPFIRGEALGVVRRMNIPRELNISRTLGIDMAFGEAAQPARPGEESPHVRVKRITAEDRARAAEQESRMEAERVAARPGPDIVQTILEEIRDERGGNAKPRSSRARKPSSSAGSASESSAADALAQAGMLPEQTPAAASTGPEQESDRPSAGGQA